MSIDFYVISNSNVTRKTRLSPYYYALANFGTSAYSRLGSDNSKVSNFNIMGDLDQVIQFGAGFYDSGTNSSSVNGSVGTDLYIVFNNQPDVR